jgi:hypothetical protein
MGRRPVLAVLLAAAALAAGSAGATTKPVRLSRQTLSANVSSQWNTWWGAASFDAAGVALASQPPVAAAETHSALITTKRTWRDSTIAFSTTTLEQLRRNTAPNPWEVGWVMFRFKDLHDYYWFMLKTNGFELGKKQGSDTQRFLVTGGLPAIAVGEEREVRVKTQGARIQVFVDGAKLVDYVDPHPLGAGSVGLYEEDSHVRFTSFSVS